MAASNINPRPLAVAIAGAVAVVAVCLAFRSPSPHDKVLAQTIEEARSIVNVSDEYRMVELLGKPDRFGITDDGKAWPSMAWMRPDHTQITVALGPETKTRVVVIDWKDGGKRIPITP